MLWIAALVGCGPMGPIAELDEPPGGEDAGVARLSCPSSPNPSGEFANTLIRGKPPDGAFPGDSWEALVHADALGYAYVEIDVRLTRDGQLVPAHGDGLESFSDCTGNVSAIEAEDLAPCHYEGSETSLLPLSRGLEGASFRGVYLDLKPTGQAPIAAPDELAAAIAGLAEVVDLDRVVAMSYDVGAAEVFLAAGLRTALKGYPDDETASIDLLADVDAIGAEMACLHTTVLGALAYRYAAVHGIWVLPWAYAGDIGGAAMRELLEGRAGGLINEDPDRVDRFFERICGS